MKNTQEMRMHWEKHIPELSGSATHWWLEGDGGVILITNNLVELIDKIGDHYGKSLRQVIYMARHDDEGNAMISNTTKYVISDYAEDLITNRFAKKNET